MSYRRFNVVALTPVAATVATVATLDGIRLPPVATVAAVASVEHANPVRPEGPTVASIPTVAMPSLNFGSVPPGDVLLMMERASVQLIMSGASRAEANGRALAIVRGALHNDARLAPCDADPRHCLTCGRPGSDGNVLLPFLSAALGKHDWLHAGACHNEHCRRQAAKVDACLWAAGLATSSGA